MKKNSENQNAWSIREILILVAVLCLMALPLMAQVAVKFDPATGVLSEPAAASFFSNNPVPLTAITNGLATWAGSTNLTTGAHGLFGTASTNATGNFATAAQGATADSALQPAGNGSSLTGLTWSQIGSTPTTLAGYGITNAVAIGGSRGDLSGGSGSLDLGNYLLTLPGDVTILGSSINLDSEVSGTLPGSAVQTSGTGNAGVNTQATDAEVQAGTGSKSVVVSALSAWLTYVKTQVQTWAANQTWSGTNNTMPNQTDAGASSVMTRSLADARGSYFIWCGNINLISAKADGASWLLGPNMYNSFSSSIPASVPAEMTKFRVRVSFAFTTNPTADTFPIYVRFISQAINSTANTETLHGSRMGNVGYPDTSGGLPGTLIDLAATASGYANSFTFTSDWASIPAGWQTNAANVGSYGFMGIIVGNGSGGSLTDAGASNHSVWGQVEFRR